MWLKSSLVVLLAFGMLACGNSNQSTVGSDKVEEFKSDMFVHKMSLYGEPSNLKIINTEVGKRFRSNIILAKNTEEQKFNITIDEEQFEQLLKEHQELYDTTYSIDNLKIIDVEYYSVRTKTLYFLSDYSFDDNAIYKLGFGVKYGKNAGTIRLTTPPTIVSE